MSYSSSSCFLAYGIGRIPEYDLHNNFEIITKESLSLYYKTVSKKQFSKESLPKMMQDLKWVESQVLEYSDGLKRLNQKNTILPFRFGTIYDSTEKMSSFLEDHYHDCTKNLMALKDHSEWGMKLFISRSTFRDWLKTAGKNKKSNSEQAQSGADYFKQKKEEFSLMEQEDQVLAEQIETIENVIRKLASGIKAIEFVEGFEKGNTPLTTIGNYAILIDKKDAKILGKSIDELNDSFKKRGLILRLSGPWPAHNFVEINQP